jgi:hypothetical protein
MERHFRITVRGQLSSGFADLFGDVTTSLANDRTVIAGCAIDRSHLEGILSHLRDLGLEMVAVETCPSAVNRTSTGTQRDGSRMTPMEGEQL